jgi:hypothetical protein
LIFASDLLVAAEVAATVQVEMPGMATSSIYNLQPMTLPTCLNPEVVKVELLRVYVTNPLAHATVNASPEGGAMPSGLLLQAWIIAYD